ncbi:hypothetical protein [Sutcliffiella sp. NC1]|uniref:hypothetical protein n=1 Tax=Sutcliffiella sp. NC1 TaxID=3004096 RepID=UPI0022DDC7CF|nr:hypothetical protein [Sutcliffiella sp. NC1]WBL17128.1 hypothetical protein O1A01_11050 [Sutcliffiella sp. NC1]
MLRIIKIILALLVITLAIYGSTTKKYEFQIYMLFFVSIIVLIYGIEELKLGRKEQGMINIGVFLLLLLAVVFESII